MHLVFDALAIEVAMEIGEELELFVDVKRGDDGLKDGSDGRELDLMSVMPGA